MGATGWLAGRGRPGTRQADRSRAARSLRCPVTRALGPATGGLARSTPLHYLGARIGDIGIWIGGASVGRRQRIRCVLNLLNVPGPTPNPSPSGAQRLVSNPSPSPSPSPSPRQALSRRRRRPVFRTRATVSPNTSCRRPGGRRSEERRVGEDESARRTAEWG